MNYVRVMVYVATAEVENCDVNLCMAKFLESGGPLWTTNVPEHFAIHFMGAAACFLKQFFFHHWHTWWYDPLGDLEFDGALMTELHVRVSASAADSRDLSVLEPSRLREKWLQDKYDIFVCRPRLEI